MTASTCKLLTKCRRLSRASPRQMDRWVNTSYQAGTLQSTYGTTEGMHMVTWGGIQRPMNVSFYKQKSWVEILYVSGSDMQEPWNHWINPTTNGLQSYNLTDAGGLNYENGNREKET